MNTPTTAQLQKRIEELEYQLDDRNQDLITALAEIDCLRARVAALMVLTGDLRVADLTGVPTEVRRLEQHAVSDLTAAKNKIISLRECREERVH